MAATASCRCLNVRIQYSSKVKQDGNFGVRTVASDISDEVDNENNGLAQFFESAIKAGKIHDAKVTYQELQLQDFVPFKGRDWMVTRCLNCSTNIYAESEGDILVNAQDLQMGSANISAMQLHDAYSQVFRILLNTKDATPVTDDVTLPAPVAQDMKTYIEDQEEAMNNRLRAFETKQRDDFKALKSRVGMERLALLRSLSKANAKQSGKVPAALVSPPKKFEGVRKLHNTEIPKLSESEPGRMKLPFGDIATPGSAEMQAILKPKISYRQVKPTTPEPDVLADEMENNDDEYEDQLGDFELDALPTNDDGDAEEDPVAMASSIPISIPAMLTRGKRSISEESEKAVNEMASSLRSMAIFAEDK